eukprot:TRINITY_DN5007_c0_g1_i2.p1 TRINITY_DN5007_c0_g1~~TRINITY_DN5007_c0_g1_i2.p1  ORF type:complete len:237 (-),score=30.25 TRINITY_DN5007_c0_g1_i2:82-792(-)
MIKGVEGKRHYEEQVLFLVYVADSNYIKGRQVGALLRSHFPEAFRKKYLEVIYTDPEYYPQQLNYNPCLLKKLYNDTLKRTYWRSKLAIDFSYILEQSLQRGSYYLHGEDDCSIVKLWGSGWIDRLLNVVNQNRKTDWFYINYGKQGGMFGFLFKTNTKSSTTKSFIQYVKNNFDSNPIDWIITDYVKSENLPKVEVRWHLFKHEGSVSTLVLSSSTKNNSLEDLYGEYNNWNQCG